MRGDDEQSGHLFSYLSLEQRIPADHPLRTIRTMTDDALRATPEHETTREFQASDGLQTAGDVGSVEHHQYPDFRSCRRPPSLNLTLWGPSQGCDPSAPTPGDAQWINGDARNLRACMFCRSNRCSCRIHERRPIRR